MRAKEKLSCLQETGRHSVIAVSMENYLLLSLGICE